ncbi:MAG: M56 family metallopeptidase [Candidatus Eremiobacteraeota bacterium]|nr:M56 family metallopeptidase [Candidatus Eremiobacteraeota bacterium]
MDALLLALLNALWQGAALIALVALALRWGLRRNATTACVVWSVAFAVVALLPAIDLALARPTVVPAVVPAKDAVAGLRVAEPATPFAPAHVRTAAATFARAAHRTAGGAAVAAPAAELAFESVRARMTSTLLGIGEAATAFARSWGLVMTGVWALVAGLLLLRLARSYAAIGAMKRGATPLDEPAVLARLRAAGHRRSADVACSPQVRIPCAVGFRRPMILIPSTLAASLDADDLARVVLHESAHLQRYDDWVNALEQAVCALQFFQPALYLARRRIDFEREVACDDRVLEDAGEPIRYAECLARIVQRQVRGPRAAVVPGFVLRRAQVVARVRRIVDRSRDASPHLRLGALVLGGAVLVATLGIARLQVPLVAPAVALPALIAANAAPAPARVPALKAGHPHHHRAHAARHTATTTTPALAKPLPLPSPSATPVAPAASSAAKLRARALVVRARPNAGRTPAAKDAYGPVSAARAPEAVAAYAAARAAAIAPVAAADAADAARTVRAAVRAEARADATAHVHAHVQARIAAEAPAAIAAAEQAVAQAAGPAPAVRFVHPDGDLLDAIDEAKYPHPSIDELIALRNQGVTGTYVREMGALGRARPSLRDILALATQGVTPRYVAALDQRLSSAPSLGDVLALATQGVSTRWLDGMAALGYPKLSVSDALALAVQGCELSYVRGLQEAGLRNLTPRQIVALRVQGVDGTYVRRLAAHGYKNLDVDTLLRLKVSGLEP